MAMNKTEQAMVADLRRQLREAKAMRFTEPVPTDVAIPQAGLAKGWMFNDYIQNPRVDVACTSWTSHSFGNDQETKSKRPMRLYSTRLLALRALRHAMEKQCAGLLAGIDEQIESEIAKGGA